MEVFQAELADVARSKGERLRAARQGRRRTGFSA
jgi:hypothetical protein